MSDFFDKLKKGAAEAGNKAKILVEINKIKLQISQREKEIEKQYGTIGRIMFEAFNKNELENTEDLIKYHCNEIIEKQKDISKKNQEISELNSRIND